MELFNSPVRQWHINVKWYKIRVQQVATQAEKV
jgi:hypothetical protein